MRNENYLEVAINFLRQNHSKAKAAFIAGSMIRNEAKAHSDIDILIVYDKEEMNKAYRESLIFEGWQIECFIHHDISLDYIKDKEIKGGHGILSNMISKGYLYPENSVDGKLIKNEADKILEQGPLPMDIEEINAYRYRISDMLDDLRDKRSDDEKYAILSNLYGELGDFYLRSNKQWSGKGKPMARLLREFNPSMASRYLEVFKQSYNSNPEDVIKLAEEILQPFGGYLWGGYKSMAPDIMNEGVK